MAEYTRTFAVIGISIKKVGDPDPTLTIDQNGLQWLWDGSKPNSIATYWRECTSGLLDIGNPGVYGYYNIEDDDFFAAMDGTGRIKQCQTACDYVKGQGVRVNDFDGLLFVIAGVDSVDSGSTTVSSEGVAINVSIFGQQSRYDFLAHETGHTIGMDHPFRQKWAQNPYRYTNGQYGDPTCIMSAMTYGDKDPTFSLTPDPTAGIDATAPTWNNAGPGVSFATLWRFLGGYPDADGWVKVLPKKPSPTQVQLCAPFATRTGTRLVVVPTGHSGDAVKFFTVEYRPAVHWDQAFRTSPESGGDVLISAGLIIHQILDIGSKSQGAGWPRPDCVEYVDTIPVPSAGDNDWSNGVLSVRIIDGSESESEGVITVEIAERLDFASTAEIDVDVTYQPETRLPGGPVMQTMMGAACESKTYESTVVDSPANVRVISGSTGFDDPTFTYFINGVPLPLKTKTSSGIQRDSVAVDVSVDTPVGYQQNIRETKNLTLSYSTTANHLDIEIPGGLGVVSLQVGTTATQGKSASATVVAQATTRRYELPPEAEIDRASCVKPIKDALEKATVLDRGPFVQEGVDWQDMTATELGQSLLKISQMARTRPFQARRTLERAATELHVPVEELKAITADITG
jgi:hypothetical protein